MKTLLYKFKFINIISDLIFQPLMIQKETDTRNKVAVAVAVAMFVKAGFGTRLRFGIFFFWAHCECGTSLFMHIFVDIMPTH